ncbi:SH3 domain-containing protein [Xanthobacteraceae bacterium Astr-EGSB]|uniref:SH3 domain-containing protein n=1 Tax=Astrobacterium formosum TaxID=3069710 RepID=UPI0027B6725C|nr:SH3 domain-containing protein [Xanthobacteraceae bacterium Astr-EGSB]
MTSISRKFLLSIGLIALSATAAAAAPAVVRSDLNLRGGPGTHYAVIGSLPGGATVDVGGCSGNWCTVAYGGQQGYASRSYLDMGVAAGALVPVPGPSYGYVDPDYYDDDDYYGPGYYGYGPSVTLGFGYRSGRGYDHGRRWGHRGPSHWGRGRGGNQIGARPPGRPGIGRPGSSGGGSWAGRPRGPSVGAAPSSPPPVGGRAGVSAGRSAPPVGAGGGGRGGMSSGGGGAATTGAGPAPVGGR